MEKPLVAAGSGRLEAEAKTTAEQVLTDSRLRDFSPLLAAHQVSR
jgi:hypothetical protein